jgi:hypothetical protein
MERLGPRRSKTVTRQNPRQVTGPTRRVTGTIRPRSSGPRMALVPQVVISGILLSGTAAFAGGAKGILAPPPEGAGVLLYLVAAVTLFVLGACMWFVLGIFTDDRFTGADLETQVKLAREALGPVLEILGLLHKSSAKPAPAS